MKWFKNIEDQYIISISTGKGSTEITEAEYYEILSVIRNRPAATDTTDYRLKTDLTWDEYEVEPPEDTPDDEEVTAEEIAAAIEEALA